MNNLEWFVDRIWTRIYRDNNSCSCTSCKDVFKNWVIIADKDHASYLYMCQELYNYFDKPLSSWDILYEHKMINNGREREEYLKKEEKRV